MENTNTQWASMSDKTIIAAIGEYLKHERLAQNKTQLKIAEEAGVNRWTINQIEKGEPVSLTSLIQILRALKLLQVFNAFNIGEEISPIELAKLEKRKRQRASNKLGNQTANDDGAEW